MEDSEKLQSMSYVEEPGDLQESTTTTEDGPTNSGAGKAEEPSAQGEGAGKTDSMKTVEDNVTTGTGVNREEKVMAEGNKL